jgi:hypothetical protein
MIVASGSEIWDVPALFDDDHFFRLNICEKVHPIDATPRELRLTSIDTWDELLEAPTGCSIVRAYENKFARPAAAAISIQKGQSTCVLPRTVCWDCCYEMVGSKNVPRACDLYQVGHCFLVALTT